MLHARELGIALYGCSGLLGPFPQCGDVACGALIREAHVFVVVGNDAKSLGWNLFGLIPVNVVVSLWRRKLLLAGSKVSFQITVCKLPFCNW